MRDGAPGPAGIASLLRRADPDRFLTALFAPPERRETLMLLYLFNHELARARSVAHEPALALIRLQWWREVVEGARRRHEVAEPLAAAIAEGRLLSHDLLAMLNGREAEVQAGFATQAEWADYVRDTAGAVATAAGRLLGADEAERARLAQLGTAYGVAGQLRNVAALAAQGRCLLPDDQLAAHGLTRDDVIARPDQARLLPVLMALAAHGRELLRQAGGRVPRALLAAALPAALAWRDLGRVGRPVRPRRLADQSAILLAYLTGRV